MKEEDALGKEIKDNYIFFLAQNKDLNYYDYKKLTEKFIYLIDHKLN